MFINVNRQNSSSLNAALGIVLLLPLVMLATFRYPGMTPDTLSYYLITSDIYSSQNEPIEPFHIVIVKLFQLAGFDSEATTQLVFFAYIFLSLFSLYKAFCRYGNVVLSMLIYILFSYVYLNLVQMRWGLSVALILWAISELNTSRIRSTLLLSLSFCVHFYSFIALPILLFSSARPNRLIYFTIPLLGLLVAKVFTSELLLSIIEVLVVTTTHGASDFYVVNKLLFYAERSEARDNRLNLFTLMIFFSYYVILLNLKLVANDSVITLFKIVGLFIFFYLAFYTIPIVSRRIMLMLVVLSIPLAIYAGYCLRAKMLTKYFLVMYSAASFYNIAFVHGLLRF